MWGNQARPFLQKEWTGVAIQVARLRRRHGQHRVGASLHGVDREGNRRGVFAKRGDGRVIQIVWFG